ncbi:hypothetical protein BGZ60DRAFT_416442 [Tricladium varicosporioides]|nr:hypothetical protein BGZ60DRAFT_416442 [Hymenoscyphus varicosporioides]
MLVYVLHTVAHLSSEPWLTLACRCGVYPITCCSSCVNSLALYNCTRLKLTDKSFRALSALDLAGSDSWVTCIVHFGRAKVDYLENCVLLEHQMYG